MTVVLAHKYEHGVVEHMHIIERRLLCALTLIVDNVGWHKPVFPSTLEQSI